MSVEVEPQQKTAFHIPSLDGIRAIAVLIVFVGHGFTVPSAFPGHLGVTIFFFLSGYLIVSLLRREFAASGTISMRKFYLRRVFRILPPAYLAIACAVVLGATGVLHATTTGWGVLAEAFSYTNYYIVAAGRDGLPPETTQFWSLGVEEHYYLIIPALLLVLFRRRLSTRQVGWALLIVAAIVPFWRIALGVFLGAGFDRLYVSTDTRIDSMLVGSAMALLWNPMFSDAMPRVLIGWNLPKAAAAGTVVILGSAFVPAQAFRLGVADSLQCVCLVAVFAYVVGRPESLAGRVLNNRFVARLGVLSFSVYLFHKMIYALNAQWIGVPILIDLLTFVATVLVAEIVYRLVESPFALLRKRFHA